MLTVARLLEEVGLESVDGADDRQIRWVHLSEIEDPTQWLSGGELLLTTGIHLTTPAKQRAFVRTLDEHKLSGVGLGTGFAHKRLPKALVEEAGERGFPLFEVPYEMPFIAITETAFRILINEQYGVLERGLAVHERLERLVIDGRGLDAIIGSIGAAVGGSALLLDSRGAVMAEHTSSAAPPGPDAVATLGSEVSARRESGRLAPFSPNSPELTDRSLVLPLPAASQGATPAWLAIIGIDGELSEFDRLVARQGAMVLALELMRERVVRETERRLAGDVLADALSGRLDSAELSGRLRPFGIVERGAVLLFQVDDAAAAEHHVETALRLRDVPALVATTSVGGQALVCALVGAASGDPVEHARAARDALVANEATPRAAASRPVAVGELRRAFHEARCALQATSLANGKAPDVASHSDLGAFTLLLALQDDEALRLYADSLLAPIEQMEGEYGGELLRSLEAFIEQNGQWERAARVLYCHRHTLRYRIRRIEDLTGRDLGSAHDRIELWLALQARELVK